MSIADQGVLTSDAARRPRATPWAELIGDGHWAGLLDPLDETLLRFLLLTGDLCQAIYDAFNDDQHSRYCGSCRYAAPSLFRRVEFPAAADVVVARYLYATSSVDLPLGFLCFSMSREAWSKESNWMGYVAVSSDAAAAATGQRVIYVAWRGTIRSLERDDDLQPELVDLKDVLPGVAGGDAGEKPKVMKGWDLIYTSTDKRSPFTKLSAREQLLATVRAAAARYEKENVSVVCVGHSLGAALATLSAFDIVESGAAKGFPVTAVAFASPMVGNEAFKRRLESLPKLRVLRVTNKLDVVPNFPSGVLGFVHVGEELPIDSRKSPYLKPSTANVGDYHNLQTMLHTVAGWQSGGGEFKLRVPRSVALVNKSCDFLKDELLVPANWWVEKNKGMVVGDDGQWTLAPPAEEDLPAVPATPSFPSNGDLAGAASSPPRRRGLAGVFPWFH